MTRLICTCLVALSFLVGCDNRTHANMQIAITDTVKTDSYVTDFNQLYPNARNFITYYTERAGDPSWNSTFAIDNRTELKMKFDIDIDRTGQVVTRTSTPTFYILTTEKVTQRPDGRTVIHHGPGMTFGPKEWEQVVAAGGDIGVIFKNE